MSKRSSGVPAEPAGASAPIEPPGYVPATTLILAVVSGRKSAPRLTEWLAIQKCRGNDVFNPAFFVARNPRHSGFKERAAKPEGKTSHAEAYR